jgi:putative glutamine amidotransferase
VHPIIGLTASRGTDPWGQSATVVPDAYIRAIMGAGGLPLVVPSDAAGSCWEDMYSRLDGILFTGGGDLEPSTYGGRKHPAIEGVDPARDALELKLLDRAVGDRKPFLGICRGCQLVNVGLGGTLYEHIPDDLPGALQHDQPGDRKTSAYHEVRFDNGALIARISGSSAIAVNSHHHQGLRDPGLGLRSVGRTADGLVEAVELPDHPFGLAVQWHPEWLTGQAHARALFRKFVEACARAAAGSSKP